MGQNSTFKINQLAKDFNVKAKDITNILSTIGIDGKSSMTTLEPDEFNLFLDAFTKNAQIKGLDKYLSGESYIKTEQKKKAVEPKPVEPKPVEQKSTEQKVVDKVAQKTADKPTEAKQTTNTKPIEKTINKVETTPVNNIQQKQPQQNRPIQQNKDAQKPNTQVQNKSTFTKPQDNRPQQQNKFNNQNNRDRQNNQFAQKDNRTIEQKQPSSTFAQKESKFFGPKETHTQEKPNNQYGKKDFRQQQGDNRSNGPIQKFKPTLPQAGEKHRTGETRIVNTRTTSVDLSKYDDNLDSFSGYQVNDGQSNKQKLKKQNNRDIKGAKNRDKESLAIEKMKKANLEKAKKMPLKVSIPDEISVGELASRLKVAANEVVKKLMLMGMMATINQIIDYDTAYLIADEFGAKIEHEVVVTIEERLFSEEEDNEVDLIERAPVVCVMGHVDHGKTSLLDAIRHTNVTQGEAGGITQAIGAYRVNIDGKDITFLDTPGHEAFTAMRARGAKSTDIAILVVAADDGIMPQTIEAINHAKAAGIDIIVAINKMDKPTANPDAVKTELTNYNLVPEEWGGDTICVPVSAITKSGIKELLESVLLVAEMKELKANPNRRAKGLILESKLDKGRGPVATVLVQNGTLHSGDIVIAGTSVGRVRAMIDDNGKPVKTAGPSVPVEITGLAEVPNAGDEFMAVEDERMARELADQRKSKSKEDEFKANAKVSLDDLFSQIKEGIKELNIIIKADVDGSAEALKSSLEKLTNEEVKVKVIHSAVGGITENDVMLATASNAIIVGFNVRPDKNAIDSAERQKIDIRTYRVIYECIEEITASMKGMLSPKYKEVLLGHAQVRKVIHVSSVGTVAGSYVQDGKITRTAQIRLVRDGIVITEDKISSLHRFKDDVKEVMSGYECGITLEKYGDIKENDIFEAFTMEEI